MDNWFFNDLRPFCRCIKLYGSEGEVGFSFLKCEQFPAVFHVSFLFNKLCFICGLIDHILEAAH